jgi:hypothetical protein
VEMHNPGKSKGYRGGSKRDSRMDSAYDATDLISFKYERSVSYSPAQRTGRKHITRSTLPPVTKAQFVQAK